MEEQPLNESHKIEGERILIYDAHCRLCVTAKKGVEQLKQDGETPDVRWVPYQSEEAVGRLGTGYRSGRPEAAFLIEPDGNIKQGLDAFLPLLPGLRGGRLLQAFTRIPFLKPLAYALYRFIARYRYRLFGAVAVEEKI